MEFLQVYPKYSFSADLATAAPLDEQDTGYTTQPAADPAVLLTPNSASRSPAMQPYRPQPLPEHQAPRHDQIMQSPSPASDNDYFHEKASPGMYPSYHHQHQGYVSSTSWPAQYQNQGPAQRHHQAQLTPPADYKVLPPSHDQQTTSHDEYVPGGMRHYSVDSQVYVKQEPYGTPGTESYGPNQMACMASEPPSMCVHDRILNWVPQPQGYATYGPTLPAPLHAFPAPVEMYTSPASYVSTSSNPSFEQSWQQQPGQQQQQSRQSQEPQQAQQSVATDNHCPGGASSEMAQMAHNLRYEGIMYEQCPAYYGATCDCEDWPASPAACKFSFAGKMLQMHGPHTRVKLVAHKAQMGMDGASGMTATFATADGVSVTLHNAPVALTQKPILNSYAHDDDRFLFEQYKEYYHTRGKRMWDTIGKNFAEEFQHEKPPGDAACLQMKVTRASRRFMVWPVADARTLLSCYRANSAHDMDAIWTAFKELTGPAPAWDYKQKDAEMFLVRCGLIKENKIEPKPRLRTGSHVQKKRKRSLTLHYGKPSGDYARV